MLELVVPRDDRKSGDGTKPYGGRRKEGRTDKGLAL
jgi:hypothetical protein